MQRGEAVEPAGPQIEPEGPASPTISTSSLAPEDAEERETRLWVLFESQRQRELASHDRLAALVFMAVQAAAAWRLSSERRIDDPFQVLIIVLITSQLLTIVVAASQDDEYVRNRRMFMVFLRLVGSFNPIFHAHAKLMMHGKPDEVHAPWGLARAVARLVYADHCTLLAYLCLAFHIDGLLDVAVQAVALAASMRQNEFICSSPYLQSLQSVEGMGDMHSWLEAAAHTLLLPVHWTFYQLGTVEVCKLYTSVLQVLCGCLAPLLFHSCNHARHAVRYAREHGISHDNKRFRAARFLHTRLCTLPYLAARLISLVPIAAGLVVLMSYMPHSAG